MAPLDLSFHPCHPHGALEIGGWAPLDPSSLVQLPEIVVEVILLLVDLAIEGWAPLDPSPCVVGEALVIGGWAPLDPSS